MLEKQLSPGRADAYKVRTAGKRMEMQAMIGLDQHRVKLIGLINKEH